MIFTEISFTAWLIVVSQLKLASSGRWKGLVREDDLVFYRTCFHHCRRYSLLYKTISLLPKVLAIKGLDKALAFGAPQHFALRKKAVGEQVEASIAQGVTQLVVLGGGFDPMACRVARNNPHVACFEMDKPAMQKHKNYVLQKIAPLPDNYYNVKVDLSTLSLYTMLSKYSAFDRSKPTLFIAEGVSMYLTERDVIAWFNDMRNLCYATAECLFTAIEDHTSNSKGIAGAVRSASLAFNHETFYWSMNRKGLEAFLTKQGFEMQYMKSFATLQKPYRTEEEMALLKQQKGEYLAFCRAVR